MSQHQIIYKALVEANESVIILGVVPIDINWRSVAEQWAKKLRANESFSVSLICESDNFLFEKAFTSDLESAQDRYSFKDLQFRRVRALDVVEHIQDFGASQEDMKRISVRVMHLHIPMAVVSVDNTLYASPWLDTLGSTWRQVKEDDPDRLQLTSYFQNYTVSESGGKFSSTLDAEILELFDHNRVPRGIYPRSSFYDTDYSQLVVWALIFDRRGRLLIHKRDMNAKDNRNMWDKSVGGHVDFAKDVSTSRGIAREVIEELLTDELKEQDIKAWSVNDTDMIYLGEWRPDHRKRYPFTEIRRYSREWCFFGLRKSQHLYSPRTMPDKTSKGLRVIADVFLFVSGPQLIDSSLGALENSEFKLIEIAELKTVMDKARRNQKIPGFDNIQPIPLFSPDLTNIMTGELRDTLIEFSNYIKTELG